MVDSLDKGGILFSEDSFVIIKKAVFKFSQRSSNLFFLTSSLESSMNFDHSKFSNNILKKNLIEGFRANTDEKQSFVTINNCEVKDNIFDAFIDIVSLRLSMNDMIISNNQNNIDVGNHGLFAVIHSGQANITSITFFNNSLEGMIQVYKSILISMNNFSLIDNIFVSSQVAIIELIEALETRISQVNFNFSKNLLGLTSQIFLRTTSKLELLAQLDIFDIKVYGRSLSNSDFSLAIITGTTFTISNVEVSNVNTQYDLFHVTSPIKNSKINGVLITASTIYGITLLLNSRGRITFGNIEIIDSVISKGFLLSQTRGLDSPNEISFENFVSNRSKIFFCPGENL